MNNSNLSPIELLIERLGYDKSSGLVYFNDITSEIFSFHIEKVLKELKPFAVYQNDGRPFILFFEQRNQSIRKELDIKIWNSQIPIAIFCTENTIEIYNGTSLNLNEFLLDQLYNQSLSDCSESSPFSYWQISDPNFWVHYSKQYTSSSLNEQLLQNIESITKQLKNDYNIPFATRLILRLVFIRFLVDRGVDLDYDNFSSDIQQSRNELLRIVQSKEKLYALFLHLKEKFNGNLFDLDTEIEDIHLTPDVFNLLYRFLSGTERLNDGQLSLFAMYDFNIIPVELISNIYEIMLGKDTQKKEKAFYTPNYLVDYILNQTVIPYLKKYDEGTVLDPACGSGIFLVECYRKLIEAKLYKNNNLIDDEILKELLVNCIYGVDSNEEAIDITIFSLYLTMLDYKDPKTLVEFKLPNIKGINLFVSNFFDGEKLCFLKQVSFDFIIGNPPWGRVEGKEHIDYCKRNNKPLQNDEISMSFVYKVEEYCCENTQCCLVLPSKLLYNKKSKAKQFREILLSTTEIQQIIELSSVVDLLFKSAKAPAIVIMFKFKKEENLGNRIIHISLKPNIFFKLFNIIVIEKNDIKFVEQALLLENDWAWKTLVYGTSWDFEIIKKLKNSFKTINERLLAEDPPIYKGTGIQDGNGTDDASNLLNKPLFNSNKNIDHFFINTDNKNFSPFKKKFIHRTRNQSLFISPYCLLTKGVNPKNYRMRSVYSEKSFIYKETVCGIKGDITQKELLLTLVGLFNSSFYAYLNLMLGSSVGIERRQRFIDEVLEFPFPDKNTKKISEITGSIQDLKQQDFAYNDDIEKKIRELDQCILDSFHLQNNPFVDHALNIVIPQIANADKPEDIRFKEATTENLIVYSQYFLSYFEKIYSSLGKHIQIIIHPKILNRFAAMELFVCDNLPEQKLSVVSHNESAKEFLTKLSIYQYNDKFYQIRDIIYFEDSSFFILKTNEYKNWHPAIAQIDLAEIVDRILSGNRGEQ